MESCRNDLALTFSSKKVGQKVENCRAAARQSGKDILCWQSRDTHVLSGREIAWKHNQDADHGVVCNPFSSAMRIFSILLLRGILTPSLLTTHKIH